MNLKDSPAEFDSLLARIRVRDESAFAELLRRCTPQLTSYVRKQLSAGLSSRLDANDVLQEVYLEAFQRFDQLAATDGSSVQRWLHTIARHRIINLARHHGAAKRGGGAAGVEADAGTAQDPLVPMLQSLAIYERTPSQSAMSHEQHLRVQVALDRLRPLYREVLQLHYLQSTPVQEIARRLDRGAGAVQMLCNRALKELRRELNGKSPAADQLRERGKNG